MGYLSDEYQDLVEIGSGLKIQIIDGYGGGIAPAVTSGGGSGHLIDPGEEPSAEEAAEAVDIRIDHNADLLGPGIGYFFTVLFFFHICPHFFWLV